MTSAYKDAKIASQKTKKRATAEKIFGRLAAFLMLYQTERLEQTETTEKENEFFDIKELKTLVISTFDKEIQNKTHQKEKNRSHLTSVLAGAGGFEPATHGFGVALCF